MSKLTEREIHMYVVHWGGLMKSRSFFNESHIYAYLFLIAIGDALEVVRVWHRLKKKAKTLCVW